MGAIIVSLLNLVSLKFENILTYHAAKIALGVILSWTRTVYKQFELLAGKSAPHEFLQLIIYNATTFSNEIGGVDTVRAYHVSVL